MNLLNEYVTKFLELSDKSKNTISSYSTDLTKLDNYMIETFNLSIFDETQIRSITPNMVRDWQIQAKNEFSNSTICRKITVFSSYFKFIKEELHLKADLVSKLKYPKIPKNKQPMFLEIAEAENLLNAITNLRDKTFITLILHTGLRISEVVDLKVSNIKNENLYFLGKGNKYRTVPLDTVIYPLLKHYLKEKSIKAPGAYIFPGNNGEKINRRTLNHALEKYLPAIDNKKISPHKLRHTCATMLHSNGADAFTLKELLGHESITTTEIYTHIYQDELKKCVNNSPLCKKT